MKLDIVSVDIVPGRNGLAVKIRLEDPKDPVGCRVALDGGEFGAAIARQIVGTEAHEVVDKEGHYHWFFEIACQIKALHVYQGGDPFKATLDIEVFGKDFELDVPNKGLVDSLAFRVGESVKMRIGTNGEGSYFFDRIVE